jgi:hypothetical protein
LTTLAQEIGCSSGLKTAKRERISQKGNDGDGRSGLMQHAAPKNSYQKRALLLTVEENIMNKL